MKNPAALLVLLFMVVSILAKSQLRRDVYRIKIVSQQGEQIKGWLVALQDSAIQVLIPGKNRVDTLISIKNIQRLSVRRRNSPGRGLGYGALTGGGVGTLIGYATYSRPDCDGAFLCIDFGPGLNAIAGGVGGALTGSLVGIIAGSAYRKYMIYGDQPSYEAFKIKMLNGPKSTMEKPPIIANQ